MRFFICVYPGYLLYLLVLQLWVHGHLHLSILYDDFVIGFLALVLFAFLMRNKFSIKLRGQNITCLMQRSFFKTITVGVHEIEISNSLRDRICGSRFATQDGRFLRMSGLFHRRKDIQNLVNEIIRIQEQGEFKATSETDTQTETAGKQGG